MSDLSDRVRRALALPPPHEHTSYIVYAGHEAERARTSALDAALCDAVAALAYYADEKNWYPVNKRKDAPVLKMVIGSVDTDGNDWIGGHKAREALTRIERALAGGDK